MASESIAVRLGLAHLTACCAVVRCPQEIQSAPALGNCAADASRLGLAGARVRVALPGRSIPAHIVRPDPKRPWFAIVGPAASPYVVYPLPPP